MQLFRLITVHPALVHFTIGALPLIVLAYGVAYWRKSAKWTFAADLAVFVTAALTLATGAFGLVSNFVIDWPGGLSLWRWLHLGFGVASVVGLAAFALVRAVLRRREEHSSRGSFIGALAISAVVLFTGWIGGEALVFQSGIAVRAAGDGALAGPLPGGGGEPTSLHDAMQQLRGHWAVTETEVASMVVRQPTAASFERVAEHAVELQRLGAWLADFPRHQPGPGQQVAAAGGTSFSSFEQQVGSMGSMLEDRADAMLAAARAEDLGELSEQVGRLTNLCANCHDQLRWGQTHGGHSH